MTRFVDVRPCRRTSMLPAGPQSADEVATALGVGKTKVRAWLKRACETGVVEKLNKPVRYALGRQGLLC